MVTRKVFKDYKIYKHKMDKVTALKDLNPKEFIEEVKAGKVFIYPTDTLYGLGCDATNPDSVMRIREIKKRSTLPFSVIVPRPSHPKNPRTPQYRTCQSTIIAASSSELVNSTSGHIARIFPKS